MESKVEQLKALIVEGEKFSFANFSIRTDSKYGGEDTPAWLTWKTRVRFVLNGLVSEQSAPMALCAKAQGILTAGNLADSFDAQKGMLLAALKETLTVVEGDPYGEAAQQKAVPKSAVISNHVFIVHGHDHALKTDLEVFLKGIGLEPIVLHRQPDEGKTIIEKFEKHADVGYAFVLLTPDELAYTVDQEKLPEDQRKKEYRARPNVIWEFGFFSGRLGRSRVCCLLKGTVTKPSDIDGLVYKDASGGVESIAYAIIKELKAAGYIIKI
ncbi:MAG TPA: TIR domain-containing protein [Terriglobia bacterium]|jgi:predicted nucleotide-binding protein